MDTQLRSILDDKAHTDAAHFLTTEPMTPGGTPVFGDWAWEAWEAWRTEMPALRADLDNAAWTFYVGAFERHLLALRASGVALRRGRPCPTCNAGAGAACPGTRDHNSRYRLAGQDPPASGTRHPRTVGMFLRDDTILADLTYALGQAAADVAVAYPEEANSPAKRAAYLLTEVEVVLGRFRAPERVVRSAPED